MPSVSASRIFAPRCLIFSRAFTRKVFSSSRVRLPSPIGVDFFKVPEESLGLGGLGLGLCDHAVAVGVELFSSLAGLGLGDSGEEESCEQADELSGVFHIYFVGGFAAVVG